jgi:hypothetical protein
MEAQPVSMTLTSPTDARTPFDPEAGDRRASLNRKPRTCVLVSAFVLGMTLATMGLLTVQHYVLGDAIFTQVFFAPAVPRVQPVSGVSGTSVATPVSNGKSHLLDSVSPASIHQPVTPSRSQHMSISLPRMEDPNLPTMSIDNEGTMKPASRTAVEAQNSPWSLGTFSLLAFVVAFPLLTFSLLIVSGLAFFRQRRQIISIGSVGGGSSAGVMMTAPPLVFHRSQASLSPMMMAVDDETLEPNLIQVPTREDSMQASVANSSAVHPYPAALVPFHLVRPGPDASYARAPAPVMFKGMSKWKLPSLSDAMKEREAADKFGDKKTCCYYRHIFWLGPQGRAPVAPDWRVPCDRSRTRPG